MNIIMYVPGMPFNGETIKNKSLGGSETAGYYLAKELAARGHKVAVFTNISVAEQGVWDEVKYLPIGQPDSRAPVGLGFLDFAMKVPFDILIGQRIPGMFASSYGSKVNFWWTHDLALKRSMGAVIGQMWNIDSILAVSEFHRKQVGKIYGIPLDWINVLRNGVGSVEEVIDPEIKLKGRIMLYSSRPERGLSNLLEPGGIMEKLATLDPSIRLKVCGYDNTVPQLAPFYAEMIDRCRILPNVEYLGAITQEQLHALMKIAWLHIYPTNFEEVSCITAMEEQAYGTPLITSPAGALPETLEGAGVKWIDFLPGNKVNSQAFVDGVMGLKEEEWRELHSKALVKRGEYSWKPSAKKIEELTEKYLAKRSENKTRRYANMLRLSDVVPLEVLLKEDKEVPDNGIIKRMKEDLDTCYAFQRNNTFQEHYKQYYKREMEEKEVVQQITMAPMEMTRINIYGDLLAKILPKGGRVLDFGCAHGAHTLLLAPLFPEAHFVGLDHSDAIIGRAKELLASKPMPNVEFIVGDVKNLPEGKFDVIIAAEVLEHVKNPSWVVDTLANSLKPGGYFILTTPYGPWEYIGYQTDYPWRAHIHHLEEEDIRSMFGHHPKFSLFLAPFAPYETGEPLGSYVTVFEKPITASGGPAMQHKKNRQAPKETLSACLIVRENTGTLEKTLKSIVDIADEIVLMVDVGEKPTGIKEGNAWRIAKKFRAQAFPTRSPLKIGFDQARNDSVAKASGDWILWIDDDEELIYPLKLVKYLRPNMYDSYAIKQTHLSYDPPGVVHTDFPNRIFRNDRGFKFYGIVHEHPEINGINSGPGNVIILPDLGISHTGYISEAVRKERFQRNLPLMLRERETYPDRWLGKFLWVRDLAHLCRYELETVQRITPNMQKNAAEAIDLWLSLLHDGQTRLVADSLMYYSECVKVLTGGGGIEYALGMKMQHFGLGDSPESPGSQWNGTFLHMDHIESFTLALLRERIIPLQGEYL